MCGGSLARLLYELSQYGVEVLEVGDREDGGVLSGRRRRRYSAKFFLVDVLPDADGCA